ncbi:carbamoyltransferase [Marinobacter sp. CHS3-4]|uniref:carbamoyltransferase family protein n=1 Tax=Marinobacter sp. CHS3-4 TaxID=3045174 RepID=UPI0024B5CB3A|nr:carbamoyltransferase [Marinobacter sp. CHS3-4]MDI9245567.1 carbamoyltransferase [Marinobacter sp. CHS3-4]
MDGSAVSSSDRPRYILGISAYYHDSAAAIICDGKLVAAAQEERFTRKKHDPRFPVEAVKFCLSFESVDLGQVEAVVFYDKPLLKFERLLETYMSFAPRGLRSFLKAMPVWLKEKLYLKKELRRQLADLSGVEISELPPLLFSAHHQSHAASAFFPSPFEQAAVLCLDGVGEWATTSAWLGEGNKLQPLWEIDFPHSLGLLYSAFTYFLGFKVNSGEYKVMGLAPYGKPIYSDLIKEHLIDIKSDGSYRLDMRYFEYCTGLRMTSSAFESLFGLAARNGESDELMQKHMDIAASIQQVTNECVLLLARSLHEETGCDKLCLAGGVALNCVANSEVIKSSGFKDVWIQPAAGDAGGAPGAAWAAWYLHFGQERQISYPDAMQGAYLGPDYSESAIAETISQFSAVGNRVDDETLFDQVASLIADGAVVGWFQGRMEFGPRALGHRSILGDPRRRDMQEIMNLKIKFRESFRPFAPSVLQERASEWFDCSHESPYMLTTAPVAYSKRDDRISGEASGLDLLKLKRSEIPAVTHVDFSARLQTVGEGGSERYRRLLEAFNNLTGCPVLINTSFNVRGEPIVATPEDAYRCFMATDMDYLVMGNYVLAKTDQPDNDAFRGHVDNFELD